jgi:hemolysin III
VIHTRHDKSGTEPASVRPTRREEIAHAITHGAGLAASAVGLVVLVVAAWTRGDGRHVVGCSIFGVTLVLLYAASTIYHSSRDPQAKRIFQLMDHIAIYLLIAGTYTPFALVCMRDAGGMLLLGVVWALAAVGIVLELVRNSRTRRTSVALYLVMGWLAVFALDPLIRNVEPHGVALLVLGGLTYSLGVVFYAWERLPYNHAVWHGFVLGGSAFHFSFVLGFVIP